MKRSPPSAPNSNRTYFVLFCPAIRSVILHPDSSVLLIVITIKSITTVQSIFIVENLNDDILTPSQIPIQILFERRSTKIKYLFPTLSNRKAHAFDFDIRSDIIKYQGSTDRVDDELSVTMKCHISATVNPLHSRFELIIFRSIQYIIVNVLINVLEMSSTARINGRVLHKSESNRR